MDLNLPIAAATPCLTPCPVGTGDWLDSSLELQCGLMVTEWHLPIWEAAPTPPAQPLTH